MAKICKIDHKNIQQCNDCFLAHNKAVKIYQEDLQKWEDMIDEKKRQHEILNEEIATKLSGYFETIQKLNERVLELKKVLKVK